MVFQDEQLFEHLDVAGNVDFGLRMRGDAAGDAAGDGSPSCSTSSGSPGSSGAASGSSAAARPSGSPWPARWRRRRSVLLLDEPLTGLDRELHDRLVDDLAAILRAERHDVAARHP